MLRSFRVANHKSIRDEQELQLMPAYDKTKPVVPVVAIFGANASGKSNLLDALRYMQTAVLTSFAAWQPGSGVPRRPFRLDPEVADQPSFYAVEILVNGVRYSYGFEVDDTRVREEWLHAYPHSRRRVIFEREGDKIRFGSTLDDSRARSEVLTELTRDNVLFLSVMALNDVAEVKGIYQWFLTGLRSTDDAQITETHLRSWLTEEDRPLIVELVRAADLGITDIAVPQPATEVVLTAEFVNKLIESGVVEEPSPGKKVLVGDFVEPFRVRNTAALQQALKAEARAQTPTQVRFHHGAKGATLLLEEQSAGTRSWIHLVCHTLDVLRDGGVLVVDEVDASLHPHLTARLINLFRDDETNPAGSQLIFTTHDATLLDDEVLARDEIWFVEKDADSGATRLYSLSDFHPRKSENREGRYLAGSYGAVPVLTEYRFRKAMTLRQESDEAA